MFSQYCCGDMVFSETYIVFCENRSENIFLRKTHPTPCTPNKVRTKERHLSWIGCGLACMHMYGEGLKGLCKARTQLRSICGYEHSLHI